MSVPASAKAVKTTHDEESAEQKGTSSTQLVQWVQTRFFETERDLPVHTSFMYGTVT
jgi:hypothetical protein